MDTLLANGDQFTDSRGLPVPLEGDGELIQRALIRLSVKRGSFREDPTLGSQLHKLQGGGTDTLNRLALSYVQDALAPLPQLTVKSVTVTRTDAQCLLVSVAVTAHSGRPYQLEVQLS